MIFLVLINVAVALASFKMFSDTGAPVPFLLLALVATGCSLGGFVELMR